MTSWDVHAAVTRGLTLDGFAHVAADDTRRVLDEDAWRTWDEFAASWNDLDLDTWMADGGRYRRRRYACFTIDGGTVVREPHQPHYQQRAHNPLNGGVSRWFAPMAERWGADALVPALVTRLGQMFAVAAGVSANDARWLVELHQFRIEATSVAAGHPTPEGLHRDGVDWVAILLVGRSNVCGGETTVVDATGRALASFAMETSLELVLLDDRRVKHGVSPIAPADTSLPASRDTLVATYRDHRRL